MGIRGIPNGVGGSPGGTIPLNWIPMVTPVRDLHRANMGGGPTMTGMPKEENLMAYISNCGTHKWRGMSKKGRNMSCDLLK